MDAFKVGDWVVTTFADSELPEGSMGRVTRTSEDPCEGVDVRFGSGMFNVMAIGLDPSEEPGGQRQA
ncbi:hypothetical protein AB0I84_23270 [Streptomyces spectabilis]|uniref:hypothetical protein n=1 Tax=Streptomyces spectabilis TaxID=68270 RepID=UPI0033E45878